LVFKDGPGTRIDINTDAPDRSLIYVKQIPSSLLKKPLAIARV
jgi:hypothetical protein